MAVIKGLTWDKHWHTDTLAALTKLFEIANKDVQLIWDYRPLDEYTSELFGANINHYDLVLIKNRHMASVVPTGVLTQLRDYIPTEHCQLLKKEAIGRSYDAYQYNDKQYSFPFTVTSFVSAYRKDLMEQYNLTLPKTWQEVLELGRLLPKELGMTLSLRADNIYDIFRCIIGHFDDDAYLSGQIQASEIERALIVIEEILAFVGESALHMSMLEIYARMSASDHIVYVPMIVGNANYSKDGYRKNLIDFGDIPSVTGYKTKSILYSSGLGIPTESVNKDMAAAFIRMVTSEEIQRSVIVDFDGHPLFKKHWSRKEGNRKTNHYFENTFDMVDNAVNLSELNGSKEEWRKIGEIIWDYLKNKKKSRSDLTKELVELMNAYEKEIVWN